MKEKFLKLCKNTWAESMSTKLSELFFKFCYYKSDLLILVFYIFYILLCIDW